MSEPVRICLVGATGLIGWQLIEHAVGRSDVRILAVARREVALPAGARMEMVVAEPSAWGEVIAQSRAQVLVCALGTTWKKAGKDERTFRAVDFDLVMACARAAKSSGVRHMIVVSSVGADAAARNFYLRVKGELEEALGKLGFRRLDILRPGLLRGSRDDDHRMGERLAIVFSPLMDILMRGNARKYRSIASVTVARCIVALAKERAAGRFIHEHDAMLYAMRRRGG